jgi:hypothetical protein
VLDPLLVRENVAGRLDGHVLNVAPCGICGRRLGGRDRNALPKEIVGEGGSIFMGNRALG